MNLWNCISLPDVVTASPDALEVVESFEHLFSAVKPQCLPSSAIVRPFTDEAHYHAYRDNIPQWEGEGLPDDALYTYAEVISDESAEIMFESSGASHAIVEALYGPRVNDRIEELIPDRMVFYAPWIMGDLIDILTKRVVRGRRPSRIETMLEIYKAGFFPYGWTGTRPHDVRFLVFPSRETGDAANAPDDLLP